VPEIIMQLQGLTKRNITESTEYGCNEQFHSCNFFYKMDILHCKALLTTAKAKMIYRPGFCRKCSGNLQKSQGIERLVNRNYLE
jgi:hypothetical protein